MEHVDVALLPTLPPTLMIAGDPEVVGCPLGDGSALLNLRTNIYYSLNPVGAFVWDALSEAAPEPFTFASLVARVTDAFDAPRAVVEADLAQLIKQMNEAGLLRCTPG